MGLKFTRINMGGPNKNFGFQLCLMERPMIEVKSVTLHQFHFLHKTGFAKVHQRDMFELTTQVNAMLRILNQNGFVLEKKDLNDLTISLLADGTITSSTGLFTNSMIYISFKGIIGSIKSDFPESVCYTVVRQLSFYLHYMNIKFQQKCKFKTLKTQALNFLVQRDFLDNHIGEYRKKAKKPKAFFSCHGEPIKGRTSFIVSKDNSVKRVNNTIVPYFTQEGLKLPGGAIINHSILDNPPDNPDQLTGQPTGQVDDLPKIDGVWMGEEKLGSSQKKKMQIGSIVLHFTRKIESGVKWYRLEKIKGAYPYSSLPEEYLGKPPNVFVTNNWIIDSICRPMRVKSLILPNGSCLFTEGDIYSEKNLIPKIEYLVKAGQRLRDIKKAQHEKATTEKLKEQSWEGSFIIQV